MEKFKETGDSQHSYQKKLDKTCYQLHIAYGNLKDLPRKQVLIKYCMIKHLILLKLRKMIDIKKVLLQ